MCADVGDFVEMYDLADVALPVGGGILDQAAGFVDAMRMLRGWEGEKK